MRKFSDEDTAAIITMFNNGSTIKEISKKFVCAPKTISDFCKDLGLHRSVKEAAYLKNKSHLDVPDIICQIRLLRIDHSLQEIALKFDSSIGAVNRICDKYDIPIPDNYAELQSNRMQGAWTDDKKSIASVKAKELMTDDMRSKLSEGSKRLWRNAAYRSKQVITQTTYWNKPENKHRLAIFRSNQSGSISKIQTTLYNILTDFGIEHTPEFVLGPYNFDCLAGRFLIECQGDYWHSQEKAIRSDRAKATYVNQYYNDTYELKYLWEHEFNCKDKVVETIKYWFGITKLELIDFDFKQIIIRRASAMEYKSILSKYHYLCNAGRGGIAYGAYFNDEIVATCIFSPLIRQNIDISGYDKSQVVELSRLCINPQYQIKNFASWFVSRCIKQLDDKYKCIVSYCDTTFNHNGSVYKALNFKQDKIVRPDYWYADERGWVMHKKTLYGRAIKMNITESEYAARFNYKKIFGTEKYRFIFER